MTDTTDAARILDGLPEYLQGKGFISHTEADAITALRAENAAIRAQIAEAEARGRIAGLKEAVCVADDHTPEKHSGMTLASHVTGRTIAAAIRALIGDAT